MGVWYQGGREEVKMRLRIVVFILIGVLIAGSIAAPLINSECEFCGGDGKLVCLTCGGIRWAPHLFSVECNCGGNPACDLCYGRGYYPRMTTKPCEECDGKGWISCPACGGDGKRNLLERIPDLRTDKLEHQE